MYKSHNNGGDAILASNAIDMKSMNASAQKFGGRVQYSTLLLCLLCAGAITASIILACLAVIPAWVAGLINTPLIFAIYTPLHEAVHGNISGSTQPSHWLDKWTGRLAGFFLMIPYAAHQVIHLTHHKNTNDPDNDPDYHVKGEGVISTLARFLTVPIFYIVFAYRRKENPKMRHAYLLSLFTYVQSAIILIALGVGFGWQVPVIGFLVPAAMGIIILAFLFDWIVHIPHVDRARFRNTNVFVARSPWLDRLWTFATLQQNYHGIHHAYPRIPYTQYRAFFRENREALDQAGLPIITP